MECEDPVRKEKTFPLSRQRTPRKEFPSEPMKIFVWLGRFLHLESFYLFCILCRLYMYRSWFIKKNARRLCPNF